MFVELVNKKNSGFLILEVFIRFYWVVWNGKFVLVVDMYSFNFVVLIVICFYYIWDFEE